MIRSRKGDRRSATRYATAEPLWGTLGLTQSLRLRNLSRGGVQIESPQPLPLHSAHRLSLPFLQTGAEVRVRVCHSTRFERDDGSLAYLVGLEFIAPAAQLISEISLLVAGGAESGGDDTAR